METMFHAPQDFLQLGTVVRYAAAERQESRVARLLYGCRNEALMLRAGAGLAARADLAFLGDVLAQQIGFLIVDLQHLVSAKLAKLGLGKELAVTAAFASRSVSIVTHTFTPND
jgi:hypothetical protein